VYAHVLVEARSVHSRAFRHRHGAVNWVRTAILRSQCEVMENQSQGEWLKTHDISI
jgi:hypothetical protein